MAVLTKSETPTLRPDWNRIQTVFHARPTTIPLRRAVISGRFRKKLDWSLNSGSSLVRPSCVGRLNRYFVTRSDKGTRAIWSIT